MVLNRPGDPGEKDRCVIMLRAGFLHSYIPLRGPTNRSNYHELCVQTCPFTDPSINYTHLLTLPREGSVTKCSINEQDISVTFLVIKCDIVKYFCLSLFFK